VMHLLFAKANYVDHEKYQASTFQFRRNCASGAFRAA
jgi:hypothetical protein